jgi:5-methylcytosine-specific restriction endonuclease McrA
MSKSLKKRNPDSNISPLDLWKMAKHQKLICPISGRRLTNDSISPDHVIPRSQGGKTELHNIQLVRKEVNLAKHTLSTEEFVKLCKDVAALISF